jgi:hypothetical protein
MRREHERVGVGGGRVWRCGGRGKINICTCPCARLDLCVYMCICMCMCACGFRDDVKTLFTGRGGGRER